MLELRYDKVKGFIAAWIRGSAHAAIVEPGAAALLEVRPLRALPPWKMPTRV